MHLRSTTAAALLFASLVSAPAILHAQEDAPARRGRKYKAPPETSHIQVVVVKKFNGKPIVNAAVVFHPVKDGKDEGSMEVKTDPEGKAAIDVIPTGSNVRVQVIADGYATFADEYLVTESNREIAVSMVRPQEQVSAYEDNSGKASSRKPGIQEPAKAAKPAPKSAPAPATPPPASSTTPTTEPKQ